MTDQWDRIVELTAERDALRAQLEGDLPSATRWLQRKVWRQAAALDALNRRVVAQRFVLRTLDELGRSLSAAEFVTPAPPIHGPGLTFVNLFCAPPYEISTVIRI